MAYKNFINSFITADSFPFTTSTFSSLFASNGWAGITSGNGITVRNANTGQGNHIQIGGTNYQKYILTGLGKEVVGKVAIGIFASGDCAKITNFGEATIGTKRKRANINFSIGKPTTYSGDTVVADAPLFTLEGWIKLNYNGISYYYPVLKEETQRVGFTTWSDVAGFSDDYEPYEEIEETISATATTNFRGYSSNTSDGGIINIPIVETISKAINTHYTAPGNYNVVLETNSGDVGNSYNIPLIILDWTNKTYEIEQIADSSFSLYTGKVVGNDFLNAFRVKYTKSNDYGSEISYPKSSLEIAKMSKTIISESDEDFTFNYDISDITETSTTSVSKTITTYHKLATGSGKFNNVTRKTTFFLFDEIDGSCGGSLTYDDDTTIALSDATTSASASADSDITLPYVVNANSPSSITLTYTFQTTYFGTLSFSDSCTINKTTISGSIKKVEYENLTHGFTPNQIIDWGSSAVIKAYNQDNELVYTITRANFSQYVSSVHQAYGKYARDYLRDGELVLTCQCFGIELRQEICFTYDETTIILDVDNVKKDYIFDPEDDTFDFDYDDVIAQKRRHTNTFSNGEVTTSISNVDISESVNYSKNPSSFNLEQRTAYGITVTYQNEWSQNLSGTFIIYAEPIAPQYILSEGQGTSTQYYDNDSDVFKYPSLLDVSFLVVFNDPDSNVEIDDLTDLEFYRDENHTQLLTAGTSVISSSGDSKIYIRSKTYNVYGAYNITFIEDTVSHVTLRDNITCFLGNKLNIESVKSQVVLKLEHISGNYTYISNPNLFNFKNTSVITSAPSNDLIVIISGIGEFAIENTSTKITWSVPYAKLSFNTSDFPVNYINNVDIINPALLVTKVLYYEDNTYTKKCEYEQVCSYSSSSTDALDKFTVSGNDALSGYDFASKISVTFDIDSPTRVTASITVSVKNAFAQGYVTEDINIVVSAIDNVIGIKLLSQKREYKVGEQFLNENDDTEICVYYKDSNDDQQTQNFYLRDNPSFLNIYPTKGTTFNQVETNKVITVSSVLDTSVRIQYYIDVENDYEYNPTKNHVAVALYLNNYKCPDGVNRSKYFLVERTDEDGNMMVEPDSSNDGEWKVADGVAVNELEVLGYLDDIGDETKNAKVILFMDYIPPIEGENNATITFPCYQEENADLINNCHFGIMFGNNNSKNRLFVSGNPNHANKDWHSGQVDAEQLIDGDLIDGNYGYFEDLSYCVYGETDNAVIGYDIVSNDKLLVLKNHSDKETTVYFRQPQLLTAINGSGTAVTDLDDKSLWQEEFSLSKGNNSVAGVSPKSIVNFNGDSLFISHDKQVVGLDLTGIVGDNQRYANSRSVYIDEDLRNYELDNAFMWTNNKYLFVVLKEKVYVAYYELKINNQYEWFVLDIANVSSVLEQAGVIYLGTLDGKLFRFNDEYKDAIKVFAGYGVIKLSANDETDLFTATGYLSELNDNKKHFFRPVPFVEGNNDPYIYYSLGTVVNSASADCDFYVDNGNNLNVIELVCRKNGQTDFDRMGLLLKRISEKNPIYFNKIDNLTSAIECKPNSTLANAWGKQYFFREYTGDTFKHLYQIIDVNGNIVPISELYRARICLRVTEEKEMVEINKTTGQFKLKSEGEIIDVVQYNKQTLLSAFKGEIIEYSNVEAYYITKPYTMQTLEYDKTIWSFTLTNDSNIPSELSVGYASNKVPMEYIKTLAKISKDAMGFDFNSFNFAKVDFDKNVVPRTYTHKRVLSGVKFVCFGFKNYEDTNSVLSSMTITYTLPYPSYGGD